MLKRRRTEQDEIQLDGTFAHSPDPSPEPSPATRKRRRRRRSSFLRQLGALAALLVLGYAVLPLLLRAGRMQPVVETTLSRSLGRQVRVGSLRFSPTFGTLIASDVSIADDPAFSSSPFFYAERVDLSVKRIPLIFSRRLEIVGVTLEKPTVTLIHNSSHWNYYGLLSSGPTGADPAPAPSVRMNGGILVIRATERVEPFILRNVNLEAPRFSTALGNTFALTSSVEGGGTLQVNGNWGPVKWVGVAPTFRMNLLVNAKRVAMAESKLTTAFAPAIGGVLSLDGTIESDGAALEVKGNAEFEKLKLSAHGEPAGKPLMFALVLKHDTTRGEGVLTRFDLSLQKGFATIGGKYRLAGAGAGAALDLKVIAQGVPVTPVNGLLSAAGLPLPHGTSLEGGLTFLDLAIKGNAEGPTTSGLVSIDNTKLMNFDLEERLSSVSGLDLLHIKRDLSINRWRSTVEVTPQEIRLTQIEVDLPEVGSFGGSGVIDASRTLDLQM